MKYSRVATPLPNYKPIDAKKISISMFVLSLPLLYVSLLHVPPSTLLRDTTFWFLISNSIIVVVAADSGFFSSPLHDSTYGAVDLYDEYVKHSRAGRSSSTNISVAVQYRPQVIKHEHNLTSDNHVVVNDSSSESIHDQSPVVLDRGDFSDCPVVVNERESSNESTDDQHLGLPLMRSATANDIGISSKEPSKSGHSRSEMAVENRDVFMRNKSIRRSATVTEKRSCRILEETEYWRMSDEELNKRVEDFIRKFNREIRLQAIMT